MVFHKRGLMCGQPKRETYCRITLVTNFFFKASKLSRADPIPYGDNICARERVEWSKCSLYCGSRVAVMGANIALQPLFSPSREQIGFNFLLYVETLNFLQFGNFRIQTDMMSIVRGAGNIKTWEEQRSRYWMQNIWPSFLNI